mmetsp:Transcript_5928/g.17069  ORF Transcript_5928/g.17069 Transcript_5928/m.17069 type:complete len:270 (+) Transcript_5928:4812-5621(+)
MRDRWKYAQPVESRRSIRRGVSSRISAAGRVGRHSPLGVPTGHRAALGHARQRIFVVYHGYRLHIRAEEGREGIPPAAILQVGRQRGCRGGGLLGGLGRGGRRGGDGIHRDELVERVAVAAVDVERVAAAVDVRAGRHRGVRHRGRGRRGSGYGGIVRSSRRRRQLGEVAGRGSVDGGFVHLDRRGGGRVGTRSRGVPDDVGADGLFGRLERLLAAAAGFRNRGRRRRGGGLGGGGFVPGRLDEVEGGRHLTLVPACGAFGRLRHLLDG